MNQLLDFLDNQFVKDTVILGKLQNKFQLLIKILRN